MPEFSSYNQFHLESLPHFLYPVCRKLYDPFSYVSGMLGTLSWINYQTYKAGMHRCRCNTVPLGVVSFCSHNYQVWSYRTLCRNTQMMSLTVCRNTQMMILTVCRNTQMMSVTVCRNTQMMCVTFCRNTQMMILTVCRNTQMMSVHQGYQDVVGVYCKVILC